MGRKTCPVIVVLCIFVLGMLILPGAATPFQSLGSGYNNVASAQSPPPPFGEGSWFVTTPTIIKDDDLKINGTISVSSTLTLDNVTLTSGTNGGYMTIGGGASVSIINGSYVSTGIEALGGSTLYINNTIIIDHGIHISTQNALIENTTIKNINQMYSTENNAISVGGGGLANVRYCYITGNAKGIYIENGNAVLENNTLLGNGIGMEIMSQMGEAGTLIAKNNQIISSEMAGVFAWESSDLGGRYPGTTYVTLDSNRIKDAEEFGVFIKPAVKATVMNNNISDIPNCVWTEIAYVSGYKSNDPLTTVDMLNNDLHQCSEYAFKVNNPLGSPFAGNWTVDREISVDSPIDTMIPLRIKSGGKMHVKDTILGFSPLLSKPLSVTVENGGELELDGSQMKIVGGFTKAYSMEVQMGGKARINNSWIQDVGYAWGTYGELAGIYSQGEVTLERSTVYHGFYGLVAGNGIATVRNCTFDLGFNGVKVTGGALAMYDSIIKRMDFDYISVEKGTADLYNTNFNRDKVTVTGGVLSVYWNCMLASTWQNGNPVGNVSFSIKEKDGQVPVVTGMTDMNGTSGEFSLREFFQTSSGKKDSTPHTITGSVMGMTNTSDYQVITNGYIPFAITDTLLPGLNITFPGLIVHQTGNPLVVNGTAWDNESGIDRVQWSLDQDLWNDATGLAKWNFTTTLYNGTRPVYLRALDKAGNELVQTMEVTLDSTVPHLVLTFPVDWYITGLKTVLVEGLAEAGSTVTVGNRSVLSTDGSFRLVYDLEEGTNTIRVTALDDTGNNNTTYVHVIRDTTAPPLIVTNPATDLITNDRTLKAFEVQGVTEVGAHLTINGNMAIVDPSGKFSYTLYLNDGVNNINLLVEDGVGNQNATVRHVIMDLVPPVLSVYSPTEGAMTNETSIKVTGLTDPWANISIRDEAGDPLQTKAERDGGFVTEVKLVEGQNVLNVSVSDDAGNRKSIEVRVTLDTTPPEITFLGATTDGMKTTEAFVFIEGQTEAGARLKMDGQLIHTGLTGLFSEKVAVPFANNSIVFESVDKAGNRNITVLHVQREIPDEGSGGSSDTLSSMMMPLLILLVVIVIAQWGGYTAYARYKTNKAREAVERKRAASGYPTAERRGRKAEEDDMEAEDEQTDEYEEDDHDYYTGEEEGGAGPEATAGSGAGRGEGGWQETSFQDVDDEESFEIEYVGEQPAQKGGAGGRPGGGGR